MPFIPNANTHPIFNEDYSTALIHERAGSNAYRIVDLTRQVLRFEGYSFEEFSPKAVALALELMEVREWGIEKEYYLLALISALKGNDLDIKFVSVRHGNRPKFNNTIKQSKAEIDLALARAVQAFISQDYKKEAAVQKVLEEFSKEREEKIELKFGRIYAAHTSMTRFAIKHDEWMKKISDKSIG